MRMAAVLLLSFVVLCPDARASAPEPERGAEPHLGHALYDLAVLRPLDTARVVVGAAFFVPLYPLSLAFGGSDDVVGYCVQAPVERAFRRPLGRL